MSAASGSVPASGGDPLAEAVALTRRLKLPHIRRDLHRVGGAGAGRHHRSSTACTTPIPTEVAEVRMKPRDRRFGTGERLERAAKIYRYQKRGKQSD